MRVESQNNKYRILTEPVDEKILHLAQGSLFANNSYVKISVPSRKMETEADQHMRVSIRPNSQSRDKIKATPPCKKC